MRCQAPRQGLEVCRGCDRRGEAGGGRAHTVRGGLTWLTAMLTDRGRPGGGGGGGNRACHWIVIIALVCLNGALGEDFTYKFSVKNGIKNQFKCKFLRK